MHNTQEERMSQVYNDSNKRPRRPARTQRNRPVLVTEQENELSKQPVQELSPIGETVIPETEPAVEATRPKGRRLPAFFSTVAKRDTEESNQTDDAAQARIARAARSKAGAPVEKSKTSEQKETSPTQEAPRGPGGLLGALLGGSGTRPGASPTGFKTRYLIGIGIYLVAANFVGLFETRFLQSIGAERELTRFNLFGGLIIVRSSTLLFLATLIIILVLLARFDLIPRNLGAAGGASANRSRQSNTSSQEGERRVQPSMKQGVSGADDDLYREYRSNQKRDKKR
jgi:hypothetical protein